MFDDSSLTEIHNIQIALYNEFKKICDEHSLRYFAAGGTLIGAVRHKGFIPWDDDIDILMPFDDYLKFLDLAQKKLKPPISLQCFKYSREFGVTMSRIRDSNTTGCTKWEYDNIYFSDYNLGIFIDIIPMFYIPDSPRKWNSMKKKIAFYKKGIIGYEILRTSKYKKAKTKVSKNILIWRFFHIFYSYERYKQKFINICNSVKEKTQRISAIALSLDEKIIYQSSDFSDSIIVPFEDTTIPIPIGYDRILTTQYGDWRTPKKEGSMHEIAVFNTTVSYKEFFKERWS